MSDDERMDDRGLPVVLKCGPCKTIVTEGTPLCRHGIKLLWEALELKEKERTRGLFP